MAPIDVHVHPPTKEYLVDAGGKYLEAAFKYFRLPFEVKSIEQMIEEFEEAGVEKMVLLAWDAETATGLPKVSNEYIAKIVDKYPEKLIGFASVDPHKGKIAVKELERAVEDLKLSGLKFQQAAQQFIPNNKKYYPLYEKAVELKIPVLFHVGMTGWGAGLPGGGGVKLKYVRPIYVDDVAADFPELKIICAHPAWPWLDEMLAIAMHKPNVYIDLSGWAPKYFPDTLIRYVNSLLSNKCLFGTDYPFIKPARWISEFKKLGLKPEVEKKILEENAKKLLKI